MQITIRGAVQGVGFRPFVYRLASEIGLKGFIANSPQGVAIEVEGEKADLESFLLRLQREKPALSYIQSLEFSYLDPGFYQCFEIRGSESNGIRSVLILPDVATCPECLYDIFDPGNRRYRYPFTNCTHCGPRFTIIESLPYDRPNTSMRRFKMCADCQREYENPRDRRFHAQPNACPACGPRLELWDSTGKPICDDHEALLEAAQAIRSGKIVAIKGLGGFHLVTDARNTPSIEVLRERKHREEKPFALMYPSIEDIRVDCVVSELEARLLTAPESPIVLLNAKQDGFHRTVSPAVAPRNPYLGIMLPYTPLHHLLMRELRFPIIATSGNLSDEPICIDEYEALRRLKGIADLFLVHNRPIVRHMDDSIARVILGRQLVLRRARGYAPLPLQCDDLISGILAVGGHLKNTIAISVGNNVFVSQHIGDLESREATTAFNRVIKDFQRLYQVNPDRIVADLHPDYLSTRYARESGITLISIQHHYAHVAACMAENRIQGDALGVSWDGTGYGPDGTIWGGEFLLTNREGFHRVASLRKFRLPGSNAAIKQPRRSALGVLYEILGDAVLVQKNLNSIRAFTTRELSILTGMLKNGFHSPWTTSAGRLFDAVASISGLRQWIKFEGQAAMELEFAIGTGESDARYSFTVSSSSAAEFGESQALMIIDWEPMIREIIKEVREKIPLAQISRKFHNTLVEMIIEVARRIEEKRVVLTGGCFQNKYLLEQAVRRLETEGFRPYWQQRIPPNDGGIALGQIVAASRLIRVEKGLKS